MTPTPKIVPGDRCSLKISSTEWDQIQKYGIGVITYLNVRIGGATLKCKPTGLGKKPLLELVVTGVTYTQ